MVPGKRNRKPSAGEVCCVSLLEDDMWAQIAGHLAVRRLGRLACVSRRFGGKSGLIEQVAKQAFQRHDSRVRAAVPQCRTWLEMFAEAKRAEAPLQFTHTGTKVKTAQRRSVASMSVKGSGIPATAVCGYEMLAGAHMVEFTILQPPCDPWEARGPLFSETELRFCVVCRAFCNPNRRAQKPGQATDGFECWSFDPYSGHVTTCWAPPGKTRAGRDTVWCNAETLSTYPPMGQDIIQENAGDEDEEEEEEEEDGCWARVSCGQVQMPAGGISQGDTIGLLFDADKGTLRFFLNSTALEVRAAVGSPADPATETNMKAPVGQRGWAYGEGAHGNDVLRLPRVGPLRWAVDLGRGASVQMERAQTPPSTG